MFDNEQDVVKGKEVQQSVEAGVNLIKGIGKWLIIPIVLIIVFNMFAFTVREDEIAVVRSLGEVKKVIVDRDNEVATIQNE